MPVQGHTAHIVVVVAVVVTASLDPGDPSLAA